MGTGTLLDSHLRFQWHCGHAGSVDINSEGRRVTGTANARPNDRRASHMNHLPARAVRRLYTALALMIRRDGISPGGVAGGGDELPPSGPRRSVNSRAKSSLPYFGCDFQQSLLCPAPNRWGIKRCFCLTSVCRVHRA